MTHYYTDNKDLPSNRRSFDYYFDNEKFSFTTDNGVFSKENVDYGSYLLIKNVYKLDLGLDILDYGCGYGPVGIIIKRFNPDVHMKAIDINSRAIELAKINIETNKVDVDALLCFDLMDLNLEFDSIILNPPIRSGKANVFSMYEKAFACLKENGKLYVVIQKKQGADSSKKKLETLFKDVKLLDRDAGYCIFEAIR